VLHLAHILSLFALGSRILNIVCLPFGYDGPHGVVLEAESCAIEDDDGYGRARRQSRGRTTTQGVE
jgi:hypothetical protein